MRKRSKNRFGISLGLMATNGFEHSIAPSAWQSLSLIKCQVFASSFMVVRTSDVVLVASWLSGGVIWSILRQGLVALVPNPSKSIAHSSPSNNSSEHEPSIGDGLTSSLSNGSSSILRN